MKKSKATDPKHWRLSFPEYRAERLCEEVYAWLSSPEGRFLQSEARRERAAWKES